MENMSGSWSVLLVEDNETYRKALKVVLEARGFTVTESDNGLTAWEGLQKFVPTMILCDIFMPIMNGIEFLEKMKSDPKLAHIPVIMLTNVQEEIEHAVEKGASEAVFKASVSPAQIVDVCVRYAVDQTVPAASLPPSQV